MNDPLLAALVATIDDERIFDMSCCNIPVAEVREQMRSILRQLYKDACFVWNGMFVLADGQRSEFAGLKLFIDHDELIGCVSTEFRDAIQLVADGEIETRMGEKVSIPNAASKCDRDFLYFMLGYMAASRQEAIEQM